MEILRRKEFEEKIELQQQILEAELVVAIVQEATTIALRNIADKKVEQSEEFVKKSVEFIQKKCSGMPTLTGYAARVQDRALKIPITKHDRCGNIIPQSRGEKFCTKFSQTPYELFRLAFEKARETEKLLNEQIVLKK